MSWIGTSKRSAKKEAPPAAPASLEYATTVSARGIAPANAVIELLNTAECRFRTVVFFDHGNVVEFEFGAAGGERVRARGSVGSRTANGPRFIYRMRLDRMSAKEIDGLAHSLAEIHRRQAAARSHDAIRNLPTTERLTRSSIRVLAQFPIVYRTPKEDFRPAKAGNVSSGGLLMTCGDTLVQGTPVELRFTLPSDVLRVYPEETVTLDVSKGIVQRRGDDPRRPFQEMVVGARVVTHQANANGVNGYGLAFTSIDGYQSEEIARYTHAVQRTRNRH